LPPFGCLPVNGVVILYHTIDVSNLILPEIHAVSGDKEWHCFFLLLIILNSWCGFSVSENVKEQRMQ